MRIGLNATCFNERPSGARQRFVGIYRALVEQLPGDEFVVFEPADCAVGSWFEGAPNVSIRKTPVPSEGRVRKAAWGASYWPRALRRERFDVFEGFNLPLVRPPRGVTVLTIHDIRGAHGRLTPSRLVFSAVLRRALQRADHVVTVSEAMRRELVAFQPGLRVSVIYNGLAASFSATSSLAARESFLLRHGLGAGFLLAVGHFEERKNYLRLVEALQRVRASGRDARLVIIGNDSGTRSAVEARLAALGLRDAVTLLSGLRDEDVRCAYDACAMVVFPSTYEGFGIPVLEAMSAGRPMALSDLPVFRELTEGRGAYFPPCDVAAMAAVIERVLQSTEEQQRQFTYAQERLSAFDYPQLARQMKTLYRSFIP